MLDLVRSNFVDVVEYGLVTALTAVQEGSALMLDTTTGIALANLTDGTNSPIFIGAAMSSFVQPTNAPQVDSLTVPSATPFTQNLTRIPVSTVMTVKSTVNGSLYTYNASPSTQHLFSVSTTTGVMTFNSAASGDVVNVTYQYAMTLADIRLIQGDLYYGSNPPSSNTQSIGVCRRGIIYTSVYDPSVDWSAANISNIVCLANGVFSYGATGEVVKGYVVNVPSNSVPFLGLFIQA